MAATTVLPEDDDLCMTPVAMRLLRGLLRPKPRLNGKILEQETDRWLRLKCRLQPLTKARRPANVEHPHFMILYVAIAIAACYQLF